jgi:hypothetical protein
MKAKSLTISGDVRPEYDFDYSGAVRGNYYRRLLKEGANVVVLDPDFAKVFRSSAAVNEALRSLLCAGRLQLIATIEDPAVIQRILAHLGLPGTRDDPQPPWSMTAAGAEQPTLPDVTVYAVPEAGAAADVCPAGA